MQRIASTGLRALILALFITTMVLHGAQPARAQAPSSCGADDLPCLTQQLSQLGEQMAAAEQQLNVLTGQVARAQGDLEAISKKLQAEAAEEQRLRLELSGYARLQYQHPVTLETVLEAHSTSQLFAIIAMAQLISRKKEDAQAQLAAAQARDSQLRNQAAARLGEGGVA